MGGSRGDEIADSGQEVMRVVLREGGGRVGTARTRAGDAFSVHHGARRLGRAIGAIRPRGKHHDIAETFHVEGGGEGELLAAATLAPPSHGYRGLASRDHAG